MIQNLSLEEKATLAMMAFVNSSAKQGSKRWHKLSREYAQAVEVLAHSKGV